MKDNVKELLREELPSCVASTQIFANAPDGTQEIWLTLRTAGLTIRTDGGVATAGGDDHDFAADSSTPYVFKPMNRAKALLVRAIQNGGTAAGRITYWG
jgi:hypothetical protein